MTQSTKQKFYNRKELVKELEKRTGYVVSYRTMVNYEKKGFISSSGTIGSGERNLPVFTDKNLQDFIDKIPDLRRAEKIHLKKYKGRFLKGDASRKKEREVFKQERIAKLKKMAEAGQVVWDMPGYTE